MPNWFYRLHYTSDSTPNDDRDGQTSGINLVTDLCILRAAEDSDTGHDLSSASLWLSKYEQFLFNFLRKNHKSKFVEKYLHVSTTTILHKLVFISLLSLWIDLDYRFHSWREYKMFMVLWCKEFA
ncbi:unnamed protein product [Trichobilharzia regenti]|nr:unnamed protein product [Trichobilharzia regenti]